MPLSPHIATLTYRGKTAHIVHQDDGCGGTCFTLRHPNDLDPDWDIVSLDTFGQAAEEFAARIDDGAFWPA